MAPPVAVPRHPDVLYVDVLERCLRDAVDENAAEICRLFASAVDVHVRDSLSSRASCGAGQALDQILKFLWVDLQEAAVAMRKAPSTRKRVR